MLQINIEYKEINGHELDCFVLKNYLHKQLILLSQHFVFILNYTYKESYEHLAENLSLVLNTHVEAHSLP